MRAQLGDDPPGRGEPGIPTEEGPPPLITDDESSDEDEYEEPIHNTPREEVHPPGRSTQNKDESTETISTWLSEEESDSEDSEQL